MRQNWNWANGVFIKKKKKKEKETEQMGNLDILTLVLGPCSESDCEPMGQ